jgi:hypothetical protein
MTVQRTRISNQGGAGQNVVNYDIDKSKSAVSDWERIRNQPNANVFLTALLLNSRWNK